MKQGAKTGPIPVWDSLQYHGGQTHRRYRRTAVVGPLCYKHLVKPVTRHD